MRATARAGFGLVLFAGASAPAQPGFRDDFEDLSAWSVIASDGVRASIQSADGTAGKALRLDFDIQTGAGFCVVRRKVDLPLPANYRFSFHLRGDAPPNNLEFKLVDPSGENVWWVNRRDYEFLPDWQEITYKARHLRFAWGPSGGKPLQKAGFLEFAIAASSGGKGWVELDQLRFEPLPPAGALRPKFGSATSGSRATSLPFDLPADGRLDWVIDPRDDTTSLEMSAGGDVGGLIIEWDPVDYATAYGLSDVYGSGGGNGGRDYIPFSIDVQGRGLRLDVHETSRSGIARVKSVRFMPPEFGESTNVLFKAMAKDAPRGRFPAYLLAQQTPWTVVGEAGHDQEALMDAHGAIEVDKLGFRIEPFLWLDGRLITWADAAITQRLENDDLPIPTVTWTTAELQLEVTAFADGDAQDASLIARYRVQNRASHPQSLGLALAFRPLQVLPPWQELNVTGGVSPIETISFSPVIESPDLSAAQSRPHTAAATQPKLDRVTPIWAAYVGSQCVLLSPPPMSCGTTHFFGGEITEWLSAGRMPPHSEVRDFQRLASAAIRYDFQLTPGETQTIALAVPFQNESPSKQTPFAVSGMFIPTFSVADAEARLKKCSENWSARVNRVKLSLPPSAKRLADTFRTVQAHIMINADGPAIQPGSRTYERSWIRDGALTSAALLSTGHPEEARAFLDWYADFQFPNGKIPCVVDRRGPDPVPEHDSTGQFLFALWNDYRFTRDGAFLERHFPKVEAAVGYLEALRAERLTDEYKNGPPELRARYGLVPESISHEGYSAKPMHSYWDCFFVLKGLKDAAAIASELGRQDQATRWAALADAFRTSLYDSMRLVTKTKGIDYIPGCVELGDFDATSTAIGLFPCGELGQIPEPHLHNTFERYYDFFVQRRAGAVEWDAFTPYEIRLAGTFVRLGRPERAHDLLKFFFEYQSPPAWNQWPEVSYRDKLAPRFAGDIPHTWVGSEFINAFRSMFLYEDGDTLQLLAGIAPDWLKDDGIALQGWPTHFGKVDLTAQMGPDGLVVQLEGDARPPRCRLYLPTHRAPTGILFNGKPLAIDQCRSMSLPECRGEIRITWK